MMMKKKPSWHLPGCSPIAVYAFNYVMFSAFNFSGGYFNPVLATALKWGCRGHTNMEHIIVYWIGACIGALLSVPLFKMQAVRNVLLGREKQE